jgi:F-type H+-transporting ATPase subunit gamma
MQVYAEQVSSIFQQVVASMSSEARSAFLAGISGNGPAALLVITAERGLCGTFSSRLVTRALEFTEERSHAGQEIALLCCGSRGKRLLEARGQTLLYSSSLASLTLPTYEAVEAMTLDILDLAGRHDFAQIVVMHNAPVRRFQYEVNVQRLLPPELAATPRQRSVPPLEIKPADDAPGLATHLLTELTLTALYRAVVESALSEQLARIATMRVAVDNAQKLVEALRAEYHSARQRETTDRLLELVNGYRAVIKR